MFNYQIIFYIYLYISVLRLPPKLLRKINGGVSEEFYEESLEELEEKLKDIFICRNDVMTLNEK